MSKSRISSLLHRMPENAVFWLVLFSLAFGCTVSIGQKISDRAASVEVHTEHLTAAQVSARPVVLPEMMVDLPRLHPTVTGRQLADRH